MNKPKVLQVLLLSDSPSEIKLINEILIKNGFLFNMHVASNENRYRNILETVNLDLIISDNDFPSLSSNAALRMAVALQHNVPYIFISNTIGERSAIDLVKKGTFDIIIRDKLERLPYSIKKALREVKIIKKLNKAKNQLHDKSIIKAQNEELKKINEAKDRFFSIIAHDLKNPLNSLLGFSGILVEKLKKKKYDESERMAEIIHHSSILAVNLLSNLLSWAQTQVGGIEFHPEQFNFSELTNQTTTQFVDAAMFKNIAIINDLTSDIVVYADKEMMATIMRNLLSNAVKFTHPNGKITISSQQSDKELIVSVSDTGIGIPNDKIDNLFNVGSNYSTYGTFKEKGTGLGLVLCREFISFHKGRIWAESNESGTIFYISLPNHQGKALH